MNGESSQQPGPADPVVDALLRASRALVSITARSLSSVNAGVTLPQFRTLVMLATRGPQTVSALADHLAVHASTMTRMCNRLVTRDLVVRAPSAVDRREVLITLSPSGATLVDEVMQTRRNELDAIVEGMSPDEREAFVTTLRRFATAAGDDGTRAVDPDDVATRVHSIGPSTYDFGA